MYKKLLFLLFMILTALPLYAAGLGACTTAGGSGTCVADGSNGCHVPKSTTCRLEGTPDGCRFVNCNASCPISGDATSGYYVPYGNAAAWNAFKANTPSTMTISVCLAGPSSSSSSSSTGCTADGTLCQYNSGNSNCNSCCTAPQPSNGLIGCSGGSNSGITFAECGSFQSTTCGSDGAICTSSGGSCFDY